MSDKPADQPHTIERLERALAEETRTSAELRDSVHALEAKLADLEARFDKRLADSGQRTERAEAKLRDQQTRLNALGTGREETMRALAETRAELSRVTTERDQLRRQLTRVDAIQTETIALEEGENVEERPIQPLPSLEELMDSLSSIEEAPIGVRDKRFEAQPDRGVEPVPAEEMVPADLIFPEEFARDSARSAPPTAATTKVLVYLDAQPPIKYPLYKKLVTIGRSAASDIQIDDDFISRLHARIICDEYGAIIEDADSKNGIKVNAKLVDRQALKHGDVISFGTLRFTFIETGPA
jgi:hypothetical protein